MTDELIGFWENDADDGSGLHAIRGYGIEFLENGEGYNYAWNPREGTKKEKIVWKRIDHETISIDLGGGEDWDTIVYELSKYSLSWIKLTEKGKEEFWIAPDPLYKRIKESE